MQSVKQWFIARYEWVVSKLAKVKDWVRSKYQNNIKKCRGTFLTLALLTLLTGLIMGSYKWVDSISQGVAINYTDGTIGSATVANQGSFAGLNSYYYTLPNHYFLISFNNEQAHISQSDNKHPSIIARSLQGINIVLEVDAKVKISTSDLSKFIQNYGMEVSGSSLQGWQIYLKEKIKNIIAQEVSRLKFYSITNKGLVENINTIFSGYETNSTLNYPFSIRIIGINIGYPETVKNSLKSNTTLGVKLLEQTSKLSQLTKQMNTLASYIQQYLPQMGLYASQRGTIQGMMINQQQAIKLSNSEWNQGLQILNSTFGGNSTLIQKYLEVYFNSLYNVTYRVSSLKPFQI